MFGGSIGATAPIFLYSEVETIVDIANGESIQVCHERWPKWWLRLSYHIGSKAAQILFPSLFLVSFIFKHLSNLQTKLFAGSFIWNDDSQTKKETIFNQSKTKPKEIESLQNLVGYDFDILDNMASTIYLYNIC